MNAGSHTQGRRPAFIYIWALICLLIGAPAAIAAEISARVDRAQLSLDETLQLTVRVSPQSNNSPDLRQLEQQFEILGQSQSSQYRNINGQVEAYTEWQLTLAPKTTGKLIIPSFEYKGNFSNAILLEVNEPRQAAGITPDVFLELTVDNSAPFVQQQVIISVKLHTATELRIQDATQLQVTDGLLVDLNDTQYQKRINDRIYTIKEWRYALFPQKSGTLEIPSQTLTVVVGNDRNWGSPFQYNTGTTKRIRSTPQTLTVKPQHPAYTGKSWLPATQLTLTESWSDDQPQWMVGEPITRSIIISAKGLTENQIPALPLNAPTGLKYYRESPERNDQAQTDGITTTIAESTAIVPTQPGTYELPPVELAWWNVSTNQQEVATLPARKIEVIANPNATQPTSTPNNETVIPPPVATQSNVKDVINWWFWATMALLITNIATLAWLFAQRTNTRPDLATPTGSPKSEGDNRWQALAELCRQPMTPAQAAAILRWLDSWSAPLGNAPLPERLQRHGLSDILSEVCALESYVYGKNGAYTGDLNTLVAKVKAFKMTSSTVKHHATEALKPLYPEA
ncbi:BatD family protein [Simiduia aestuariiviva]|uniref:Protein BatD n=1 Tax=Simiduia aestuariiviva TaxID=1510459 RepID=A0A839USS4_9GAMM|nr:BatD family protein [Simiduia aestuariiviva]MBB3168548.1 hypothetical protein [Simiduia aestuariiviva]